MYHLGHGLYWFHLSFVVVDACSYLWFFMEPLLAKADNYSFLKKLVENVKQNKDVQAPDDEQANKVKECINSHSAI